MRTSKIAVLGALAMLGLGVVVAPKAKAAYVAYLYQSGSNVVGIGSGSLDIADLTLYAAGAMDRGFLLPRSGVISLSGPAVVGDSYYLGFSGPPSFGPGNSAIPDNGSGNIVLMSALVGVLGVPINYVSGSALGTSTATWDSTTLAALGAIDGTYTWTWGSAANADSFTLHIGTAPSSVPEPVSSALLGSGLVALALKRSRRKSA